MPQGRLQEGLLEQQLGKMASASAFKGTARMRRNSEANAINGNPACQTHDNIIPHINTLNMLRLCRLRLQAHAARTCSLSLFLLLLLLLLFLLLLRLNMLLASVSMLQSRLLYVDDEHAFMKQLEHEGQQTSETCPVVAAVMLSACAICLWPLPSFWLTC